MCNHPQEAIVSGREGTSFCRWCEEVSRTQKKFEDMLERQTLEARRAVQWWKDLQETQERFDTAKKLIEIIKKDFRDADTKLADQMQRLQTLLERQTTDPLAKPQKIEKILCAAIYVDTGKAEPPRRSYGYPKTGLMFLGWRHGDCFTAMDAWSEHLTKKEWKLIGEEQLRGKNQGFMTSTGRFVDREEAAAIAWAAGQTTHKKSWLTSEDIY